MSWTFFLFLYFLLSVILLFCLCLASFFSCFVFVVIVVVIVECCCVVCLMMSFNVYVFVCFCVVLNMCRKNVCIVAQNIKYIRKTKFDQCNFHYSQESTALLYFITRQLAWIISLSPIFIHYVCSCFCILSLMPPCLQILYTCDVIAIINVHIFSTLYKVWE